MSTEIKPCSCKNEYQDAHYGKGMRVHNPPAKPENPMRCTVCYRGTSIRARYSQLARGIISLSEDDKKRFGAI
jgi:hypothetical protein